MATKRSIGYLIVILSMVSCASKFSGKIMVSDPEARLQDGRVNIMGVGNGFSEICSINQHGAFASKKDMPNGDYLVEVILPGFKVFSKRMKILEQKEVRIKMKKLSKLNHEVKNIRDFDMSRASGVVSLIPPKM